MPDTWSWMDDEAGAISALLATSGSVELAVAYSFIFWPRFVVIDGHVLRAHTDPDSVRTWSEHLGGDASKVEGMLNHVHLKDLHQHNGEPNELQLRYFGRLLAEIHRVKLARDFPDQRFEVDFNDEPGLNLIDYQFTFWRVRD